jgi:signal peptide peptidase SppA
MTPPFAMIGGLFNQPVALHEGSRDRAVGLLADWAAAVRSGRDFKAYGGDDGRGEEWKPYWVHEGVAIVPVKGVLVHRVGPWAWLANLFGVQGYDQIRLLFMQALADEDVDAIVLDIDSGGGDVAGCFDLVDTIYAAREIKPIRAILDENAYSAAYAIASAAERISVPRTGGTGSVGVIAVHVSIEEMLKKAGVAVTEITKGERKSDFSEFAALSEEARARLQADVNATGALFDETVARNRGLAVKAVRDTQARTFQGADGVTIGFADEVAAPDAAFRALLQKLG